MAGPGIRYHYMAESLSGYFDVTVGFFDPTYLPEPSFHKSYKTLNIPVHSFESAFKNFDVIIAHWLSEDMISLCNAKNIFVVFDLYVPGPVENLVGSLFSGKQIKADGDFEYNHSLEMYRKFFENGDLFLFSNRRQLDYWTGYAFGDGQVQLSTYAKRPLYERFIYAPMGIDSRQTLVHKKDIIKGVIRGINKDDKVLLWTGGIWGHFDAQVLIRTMKRLEKQYPEIKLVFFGTHHPNPNVPEMKESLDTRELSEKLGLTNKTVFFNDGWVEYPDRINYLMEADVAVSTHKDSIETEFAHRTRILDHFLATLPTIATSGDYFSDDVIGPNKLGVVVPAGDESALEKAILDILKPKSYVLYKKNIETIRKSFDWSVTMRTLIENLSSDTGKLPRLSDAKPIKAKSKSARLARKMTPTPVKKALIRTLRIR